MPEMQGPYPCSMALSSSGGGSSSSRSAQAQCRRRCGGGGEAWRPAAAAVLAAAAAAAVLAATVSEAAAAEEEVLSACHGRQLLESRRVLGVGAGVFLLGFFLVLCVLLCLFGSRTRKPGAVYAASAALYAVVAAVLLGSPKGHRPPPAPQGYDRTIVPMVLTGALVAGGVAAAGAGMLAFHARAPVYARQLSYHADVLRQR